MASATSSKKTADPTMPLEQFCQQLSIRDRRVELVNAFFGEMKREGVVKDTEAGFDARFTAFCGRPAK